MMSVNNMSRFLKYLLPKYSDSLCKASKLMLCKSHLHISFIYNSLQYQSACSISLHNAYWYRNCKSGSSDGALKYKPNHVNCRGLHLSRQSLSDSDLPSWLKGIASEVSDMQDITSNLDSEEEHGFTMENDIVSFFLSRAISYSEIDAIFMVSCPSCGQQDHSHDLFIDKSTGFCVCPGCLWEGCWEDFVELLNSFEKYLSETQLENIINSSSLIDGSHEPHISCFPFNLSIEKLQETDARISKDHSKLLLPLEGEDRKTVGFASISLLYPDPEIVIRLLESKEAVFSTAPVAKKTTKRILLVSDISDALKLWKYKIPSLVMIGDHKNSTYDWALQNFKNVVLWYQNEMAPQELLSFLLSKNINTFLVKATKDQRISLLAHKKISQLISEAIIIDRDSIIMFTDVETEVYGRIVNKDEIYGTKWTRFKEINNFLLGHRKGELTILSGPTGSGKTTFMSEYSLDLCTQGVLTLWGSFEISIPRLCEIMLQQYSGSPLSENYSEFKVLASKFAGLPLYFMNTHGQQPVQEVIDVMIKAVLLKGVQHVVIDNLQFMLGLHGASNDWWLEQDRTVSVFRQFASAYNCHVTLIVHPRKMALGEKLNINTISGGARVTQEADNVLLIQTSENKDGSRNPLGPKTLQIVKNRYGGTLGEMKMRFHKDSLTFSSCFSQRSKEGRKEFKSVAEGLQSLAAVKGLPSFECEDW